MLKKSIALFVAFMAAFFVFFIPVKFHGTYTSPYIKNAKQIKVTALTFKPAWSGNFYGKASIIEQKREISGENSIDIFFLILIPVYIFLTVLTLHFLFARHGLLSRE